MSPRTTDHAAARPRRGRTPAWAWALCCVSALLAAPLLLIAAITLLFSGGGDPFRPLSTTELVTWAAVALLAVAVPVVACRLTLRSRRAVLVVAGVGAVALLAMASLIGLVPLA